MTISTSVVFIGIPHSNPTLDNDFQSLVRTKLLHIHIEPITLLDGNNVPQWNFTKAYFVHINANDSAFNLLVSEFGGNDGSDLDAILLGYNTKEYYLNMFEILLE
jgi:hypothetical protein